MTDRARRGHEESAPGVWLVFAFAAAAALLTALVAWRHGGMAAASAGGAVLFGGVAAFLFGVRSGLQRSARARADLHEALVTAEAQIVRARLTALKAPSTGSDQALADERALRAKAEVALTEEQRGSEALQDQMQAALIAAQRKEHALREEMEAALAAARRALAEEQARRHDVSSQADHALSEERRQRLAWKEQADKAQREIERLSSEARSRKDDQNGALREVERLLSPYIERERLLLDLARIDGASRSGLPDLLDAIAKKAHFASIVLSDESGLPVAASRDTRDPEGVAATSSLLFTLADRLAERGSPAPIAVLVHDEANETILHRLFRVETTRFLLTASGRGHGVMPETLDPTLHSIERALLRQPLSA